MHMDESRQVYPADGSGEATSGRALIPLVPAANPPEALAARRPSPFLAQLLAAKGDHPQSRTRRRATPEEAIAAYRNVAALAD
jgi:hypothetical protein